MTLKYARRVCDALFQNYSCIREEALREETKRVCDQHIAQGLPLCIAITSAIIQAHTKQTWVSKSEVYEIFKFKSNAAKTIWEHMESCHGIRQSGHHLEVEWFRNYKYSDYDKMAISLPISAAQLSMYTDSFVAEYYMCTLDQHYNSRRESLRGDGPPKCPAINSLIAAIGRLRKMWETKIVHEYGLEFAPGVSYKLARSPLGWWYKNPMGDPVLTVVVDKDGKSTDNPVGQYGDAVASELLFYPWLKTAMEEWTAAHDRNLSKTIMMTYRHINKIVFYEKLSKGCAGDKIVTFEYPKERAVPWLDIPHLMDTFMDDLEDNDAAYSCSVYGTHMQEVTILPGTCLSIPSSNRWQSEGYF